MKKIIALLLAAMMVIGLFAACQPATENPGSNNGPEKITLTVWGPTEDQKEGNSYLKAICDKFAEAHPEYDITWNFGVCSEGDAGTKVTQDPETAADVYMFANDQLGALIQAGAIAKLGGTVLDQIKADNSEAMVNTVTSGDGVYGVPYAINTWFMYYDKSVYTEEDIKSLDAMMEKKAVAFPITNTWYLPAFYFANGGTMFGDGTQGSEGIKFGGDNGAAVTAYLANAIASGKLVDADGNGSGLDDLRNGKVGAYFSGTWDATAVQEALGENFAAAQLPCITINGESKQLMSFAGSKALGVNPHSKHLKAANQLAAFMGSAEAQELHYNMRNGDVVPCNTTLLKGETFSKNVAAVAQEATFSNTSVIQPSIPEMSAYWTNAGSMGTGLVNKEVTVDNAAEKTEAWNTAINNTGL
ncbi:MAG: extracellular solute-binding protein [Ruminococcaceae bacterium]|nr:extracellular solute-binding protein [Oscillospiraceae bacterium]